MPPVAAAIGYAVATWGAATVIAVGVAVVAAGMAYASYQKMKNSGQTSNSASSQKQMFRDAVAPKQILMGHPCTSGPMVFAAEEGRPDSNGTGEKSHIVVHLAGHPCNDVTNAWLNDEELILIEAPEGVDIAFGHKNGYGWVYIYLGNQTSAPVTLSRLPDWSSEMVGRNQCYAHIVLRSKRSKWPAGLPNFKCAVKGVEVFDPRINKTKWTDNPALLMRWYRNTIKHGVAMDEDYIAAANICDELVLTEEGTYEKRYRCNYAFPCNESPRKVTGKLARICAGSSLRVSGQHAFHVGAYYGPGVIELTADDIIGDLKTTPDIRRRDRINTVTATYVDPDSTWNTVDMPQVQHDGYLELDGVEIDDDLELECCPSPYQAQRVSWIHLRTIREGISVDIPCNMRGAELLPGTVFKLTLPENSWDGVEFKVEKWKLVHKDGVTLQCKQHLPENYADDVTHTIPTRASVPNKSDPLAVEDPTSLTYQELYADNTAQALIGWEHQSFGGITYELSFYKNGSLLRTDTTLDKYYRLTDGFTVGSYEVRIKAINSMGGESASVSLAFTTSAPDTPIGCDIVAGNWSLQLTPQSSGVVNFDTMYDFALGFVAETADEDLEPYIIGTAKTITVSNLKANTEYQIAIRELSRWGNSAWYRTSANTTFNSDDVLELISGQVTQEHLNASLNDFLNEVNERSNTTSEELASLEELVELNKLEALESIDNLNTDLIELDDFIDAELDQIKISAMQVDRLQRSLSQSVLDLTSSFTASQQEYQRRMLIGEAMIGAVVEIDPGTGKIINLAYNYADQKFTEAGLVIDGVNASVTINAQEISRVETEAGTRISNAEAAIQVNAGLINQKASFSEVSSAVASAIEAITPAKSWQFNTTVEGWSGATWQTGGAISGTSFSIASLSVDADENPVIRIRAKGASAGTLSWNNGSQQVPIAVPTSETDYNTQMFTLTESDGWTGTITSLQLAFDATIDFIEIGKPSAAEQALSDLTSRTTTIEEELDAENARWSVYVTQDYWDANALTQTDIQQQIDAFNSEWKVSATYQSLTENNTVEKANAAQTWVNAAESNITSVVAAYTSQEGGIDDQLDAVADQLTTAQQSIDALTGDVTTTVTSLTNVENALGTDPSLGLNALMDAYSAFLQEQDLQQQNITLAYAQQTLSAHSSELQSQAESLLQLGAIQDQHTASLSVVNTTLANQEQALADQKTLLQAEISDGDSATLTSANQTTATALATATQALADQKTLLQAEISDGDSATLTSANQTTATALATATQALADQKTLLQAEISDGDSATLTSANQTTATALATATQALADQKTLLQAEISDGDSATLTSANQTTATALATATQALADQKTLLQAEISDGDSATLTSANQTTATALATATQALADQKTLLQAEISDGDSATLTSANQTTATALATATQALADQKRYCKLRLVMGIQPL